MGHVLMVRPKEHPERKRRDGWLLAYLPKIRGFDVGLNSAGLPIHLMALAAPSLRSALFFSGPVMAQTQSGSATGSEMLQHCETADRVVAQQLSPSQAAPTTEEAMIQGFCLGAVSGVRFLAAASTKNTQYPICVPENGPAGQALGVVVRYLRSHPERQSDNFLWIIMDALRETWPCH